MNMFFLGALSVLGALGAWVVVLAFIATIKQDGESNGR